MDISINFQVITCCKEGCHIMWAITNDFYRQRVNDKKSFYCPNGHSQYFLSETEEEKLRKKVNQLENERMVCREEKKQLRRSLIAYKGHLTRTRAKQK